MPLRWQQLGSEESWWRKASATRWSLSQYWITRVSEIRDCTIPLGRDQSVGRIGSQTTRTRIGRECVCSSNFSIADAPRKQVGQVGDSSSTNRALSLAPLKSRVNWSRLFWVSDASGV